MRNTSPSSSTSSYQSELEESLLKSKSVREYTLEKRKKKEPVSVEEPRVRRTTHPIRKFKINGWSDNFYSHLLDWSYNNFICVANNQSLLFYNMMTDSTEDDM